MVCVRWGDQEPIDNTLFFLTFGHPPSAWFIPWDMKSALMVFTLEKGKAVYLSTDINYPTSFSDATDAHCMTLDTGLRGMYWLCSSGSDLTSSIMWPEVGHIISCRCWTVDPPCWSANWTGLLILLLFLVMSSLISSSFSTRSSLNLEKITDSRIYWKNL